HTTRRSVRRIASASPAGGLLAIQMGGRGLAAGLGSMVMSSQLIVVAFERDVVLCPEQFDELDPLEHALDSMATLESIQLAFDSAALLWNDARAHHEHRPPARQQVEARPLIRQQDGIA